MDCVPSAFGVIELKEVLVPVVLVAKTSSVRHYKRGFSSPVLKSGTFPDSYTYNTSHLSTFFFLDTAISGMSYNGRYSLNVDRNQLI